MGQTTQQQADDDQRGVDATSRTVLTRAACCCAWPVHRAPLLCMLCCAAAGCGASSTNAAGGDPKALTGVVVDDKANGSSGGESKQSQQPHTTLTPRAQGDTAAASKQSGGQQTPRKADTNDGKSPANNHAGAHIHSAASSTQLASELAKGGAHGSSTAGAGTAVHTLPQRHSHSGSKLDVLNESGTFPGGVAARDTEADRAEIVSKILVCRNCEDPMLSLAVWCTDCHRDDDPSPPVYCEACNTDMHAFAKTKNHVREPLTAIHTTRMKTMAELGLAQGPLPSGLPALESLACSNCDGDVNVYCASCKTLLCTTCARDIHNPKLLRAHLRTAITCKFIVAGYHAATKIHEKKNDQPAAAARTASALSPMAGTGSIRNKRVSVVTKPAPAKGSALAALAKKSSVVTGSAAAAAASASSKSPTAASSASASSSSASASLAHSKLHGKVRPRATETTDLVPVANPGAAGDVFTFSDPTLSLSEDGGGLRETQQEFRNLSNPYDVIGVVQVVSISCGTDHMGAVTAMGSLFMWGSNVEGQLGCGNRLGQERHSATPLLIEFERHNPVKQVACGSVHTLALCQDSRVYSWGQGAMGKLGLISDADQDSPQQVMLGHWGPRGDAETVDSSGSEEVLSIACGQNNSGCVVRGRKDKHQLYLWGEGASGQIPQGEGDVGRAGMIPKLAPSLVLLHTPEQRADPWPELSCLAFGTKHVAVATKNGAVFTWGDNSFGQCGYTTASNDGDNVSLQLTPRLVPKLFLDGVKAKSIACGERHTTVLASSGDVWSFGSGESHQMGILDNVDQFQPQRAVGLGPAANNPIVSVSVGASITAAVNDSGETYMWGYGVESPLPKIVEGLRGKFAQVCSVGSNQNVAVLTGSNKDLYEWQFDGAPLDAEEQHGSAAGEAGMAGAQSDGGQDDREGHSGGKGTPALNSSLRGKKLTSFSSGKNHYAVVTADGKLLAWGSNYLHECGLKLPGEISYVPHPLEVKFLSGPSTFITDVRCSVEHSIALDSLGRVHTWGTGFEGRLGHVSNADVPQPKVVQSLVDSKIVVKCIAIGPSNCGIVSTEGAVYMWGAGNGGQIGNDDLLPQFKPVLLKALAAEKVTALAIGNYHALALTEKHEVWTWGDNKFGQLGLYPAFQEEHAAYPQPVLGLNLLHVKPASIDCGDNVCMVLSASGELYGWGTGETMQLCTKHEPDDGEEEEMASGEDVPNPVKLCFPFQKPGKMTKIKSFSVRDINCVCVTEDRAIWSWGWDLGQYPSKLALHKPASGSAAKAAAAASSAAASSAAKPMEEVRFERVTLGHTRMLLIT